MQLILKPGDSSIQSGRENPPPVSATNPCPKPPAEAADCLEVSQLLFPVTVKAKMESTDRILTLKGESSAELTVTFKPEGSTGGSGSSGSSGNSDSSGSSTTFAAAWLSHSAALILSNLAMVYLLP
ncbi:unnamed protein product [Dibothriocephalus latus]|uniref:Uncharacterized protein n=1 Tax=Dibothriocephalus latus TaxID=60516 RepID=A0A3P7NC50_DIBLA|nr:unnamed protein product [Dibothriocephalus latus]